MRPHRESFASLPIKGSALRYLLELPNARYSLIGYVEQVAHLCELDRPPIRDRVTGSDWSDSFRMTAMVRGQIIEPITSAGVPMCQLFDRFMDFSKIRHIRNNRRDVDTLSQPARVSRLAALVYYCDQIMSILYRTKGHLSTVRLSLISWYIVHTLEAVMTGNRCPRPLAKV